MLLIFFKYNNLQAFIYGKRERERESIVQMKNENGGITCDDKNVRMEDTYVNN